MPKNQPAPRPSTSGAARRLRSEAADGATDFEVLGALNGNTGDTEQGESDQNRQSSKGNR
ncbi:hypothetical protein [Streptomyces nanshensis]|uniref:Uncharacterized protein n=1 Tax=Streptomyces nanshensis TaxID=518642 RepID=A0A1E7LCY5_9ACTN|nr:hypothetical protein [Streptomyces nanshensis]OEV14075.1 hypothetical protein AN218_00960 [Streptomyces nanshensis]